MTQIKGRINWFDSESGHGSIISDDDSWYRIHEFSKLLMPQGHVISSGQPVIFQLSDASIHPIVTAVMFMT